MTNQIPSAPAGAGSLVNDETAAARWPLERQLLVPVLSVVVVAIALSSLLTAWLAYDWSARRQTENLERVVHTLTGAGFPLTNSVLSKMSGLSGADFLVLDRAGEQRAATIDLSPATIRDLAAMPPQAGGNSLWKLPRVSLEDRDYLAARLPVDDVRDGDPLELVVLLPTDRWWATSAHLVVAPLAVGGASALVLALILAAIARRAVRPIEWLRARAMAIAAGDFRRLELPARRDEVYDLSRAINEMVERLEQYAGQVRQHERLRTLGQLGGGLAHQLRNFATGARIALDLHGRDCPQSNGEDFLVASRQLTLMESYLQRFLRLGRNPVVAARALPELDLVETIDDVLGLVGPTLRHWSVQLEYSKPEARLSVRGDADALQQLLTNVVLNAAEATCQEGAAARRVQIDVTGGDERVEVAIRDCGPGPAAGLEPRLFEPFASDKPDGTGLGLSMARDIAAEHGGSLDWHRSGEMTCFIVRLPAAGIEEPHGPIARCR